MAQFVFTCPFCKQQFSATDEMIGQSASCSNCGAVVVIQKQMQPLQQAQNSTTSMMVWGILGVILWIIPLFSLPIPIIGFVLSYNKNYRLGIILNAIGMGLSILWTFICIAVE